jgi:hypothetical protein
VSRRDALMTNNQNDPRRLLRLVSDEEAGEEVEILGQIKPLPSDVRPSSRFLAETRGRLLRAIMDRDGRGLAA